MVNCLLHHQCNLNILQDKTICLYFLYPKQVILKWVYPHYIPASKAAFYQFFGL
jgi:hypothetical protein